MTRTPAFRSGFLRWRADAGFHAIVCGLSISRESRGTTGKTVRKSREGRNLASSRQVSFRV